MLWQKVRGQVVTPFGCANRFGAALQLDKSFYAHSSCAFVWMSCLEPWLVCMHVYSPELFFLKGSECYNSVDDNQDPWGHTLYKIGFVGVVFIIQLVTFKVEGYMPMGGHGPRPLWHFSFCVHEKDEVFGMFNWCDIGGTILYWPGMYMYLYSVDRLHWCWHHYKEMLSVYSCCWIEVHSSTIRIRWVQFEVRLMSVTDITLMWRGHTCSVYALMALWLLFLRREHRLLHVQSTNNVV